jgi:hypothetical protein
MAQLNLGIVASSETLTLEIESTLEQDIRKGQLTDDKIAEYRKLIKLGKVLEFREDEQGNYFEGSTRFSLLYSPWEYQDVSGLETEILVVWNEERCSSSCSFV